MKLTTRIGYFLEVTVDSGHTRIREDVGHGYDIDKDFVNSLHEVIKDCYRFENKENDDIDFIEYLIDYYQLTEREIDNLVERLRNR